jgi:hypothetical protein
MNDIICQRCRKCVSRHSARFCPSCGHHLGQRSELAMSEGRREDISVALDEVTAMRCGLFIGLIAVRNSTSPRAGRVAQITLAHPPREPMAAELFLGDHEAYLPDGLCGFRVMLVGMSSDYVKLRVTPLTFAPASPAPGLAALSASPALTAPALSAPEDR